MARGRNRKVADTWQPNILKRYVFFNELETTNKSLYTHVNNFYSQDLFKRQLNNKSSNNEEYNNYILNYLKMLQALAEQEKENEIKYINALKDKAGFPIENYYTNNKFDYIKFIAALQLVHSNLDRIRSIVAVNKKNINTINDKLKNYKQSEAAKDFDDAGENAYDKLINDYIFSYGNYIDKMNELMSSQLEKSFSDKVNEKIQEFFSTLSTNFEFIEKIRIFITQKQPEADIVEEIQNWCVELLRDELTKVDDVSKIDFNPKNISDDRALDILDRSLKATYSSVMSTVKTTIEKIIDSALNKNKNIANLLLEDGFQTLNELLDVIKADDNTKEIISKNFSDLNNNIQKVQANTTLSSEEIINKVAGYKAFFTKKVGELIRQQLNQSRGLSKQVRKKIIDKVIANYETAINGYAKTTAEYIAKKIKVTKTSANSVAEILASPNFEKFLKNNISDIFIPGKNIMYKTDLTFNVHPPKLALKDLKTIWTKKEIEDINFLEKLSQSQGKNFLTKYKKLAHGSTSVEKAGEAYKETIKTTLKQKQQVLTTLDEHAKKLLNDYFNSSLDGAISVKDYHYYNNEKGYHMGSMGGDNRVVDAIPNILKMLELGGITGLDVDVIITALLNSFEDSVIGTRLVQDIKALLIGGAAMMLFDDGFANAEKFLEKMKEELYLQPNDSLPTGGSLHLLYLNNIYIPQSYVLFSIIDKLKVIYNDIVKTTDFNSKNSILESSKNSLEIYNPLNYSYLKKVEDDSKYPTRPEKWNQMSQIAQNEVKIHFLFMAGMLDILDGLEDAFNNIK